MSCYSNHRAWLFDSPDKPKAIVWNTAVAPNGWGVERHRRLQQSKFMLATHQDGFPYIEPLRFALAAAYGLLVLSEYCEDLHPYKGYALNLTLQDIKCHIATYSSIGYQSGLRFRERQIVEFPFRKCVEDYVGRLQ